MDYAKLVKHIPLGMRGETADKLVDTILASKNNDKMPSSLANAILSLWRQNLLESEHGLAALLEAASLLEHEKTLAVLEKLQLTEIIDQIRGDA